MSSRPSGPARRRHPEEIEKLVLNAIVAAGTPLSAYDIAAITSRAGPQLVPNQVYRTLARLIGQGRVQRIESLNAYLRLEDDADACLICDDCHRVDMVAIPDLRACMVALAGAIGFMPEQRIVEIHGHCPECLSRTQASSPN